MVFTVHSNRLFENRFEIEFRFAITKTTRRRKTFFCIWKCKSKQGCHLAFEKGQIIFICPFWNSLPEIKWFGLFQNCLWPNLAFFILLDLATLRAREDSKNVQLPFITCDSRSVNNRVNSKICLKVNFCKYSETRL